MIHLWWIIDALGVKVLLWRARPHTIVNIRTTTIWAIQSTWDWWEKWLRHRPVCCARLFSVSIRPLCRPQCGPHTNVIFFIFWSPCFQEFDQKWLKPLIKSEVKIANMRLVLPALVAATALVLEMVELVEARKFTQEPADTTTTVGDKAVLRSER